MKQIPDNNMINTKQLNIFPNKFLLENKLLIYFFNSNIILLPWYLLSQIIFNEKYIDEKKIIIENIKTINLIKITIFPPVNNKG